MLFFDLDTDRSQRRVKKSLRANVAALRAGRLRAAGLVNKSEEKDD